MAESRARRIVWVARHGNRLDFEDPTWASVAERPHDPPLAPEGFRQAVRTGTRLESEAITHVFSSPFLRTLQTADAIAERLGLRILVELGLSEWMNRDWFARPPELMSTDELATRFPRVDLGYASRGRAAYGETGEEAMARAGSTAVRLVSDFVGDLLLVAHGASVLGVTAGLLSLGETGLRRRNLHLDMPYACLVKLVQRGQRWQLVLPCDTSHLRDATAMPRDSSRR